MTKLSTVEATEILTGLGDVTTGLAALANEVHLQGEILIRIVQLLTPTDEQSSPSLHELLTALIGRLDRQSIMLQEILEAQRNFRSTLPHDVAQAIDDANESGGSVVHGTTGKNANGANGPGERQP
jgi:hypothetical protein